jgi:hypothetical protein
MTGARASVSEPVEPGGDEMAKAKDDDGGNKFVQFALYAVVVLALIGVGLGPVRSWLNRTQRASLKAGMKNIRDAYTAFYTTKSRYPADDLKELMVVNGGNIQEFPTDPVSGSASVVTSLTGEGGWFHDTQKHDVFVNQAGDDYFGQPYSQY